MQGAKASAGKQYGTSGAKIGHASLTGAFSEAAVLCLRAKPAGQKYVASLESKHGKDKALPLLAQKLARAVYCLWQRDTAFDRPQFLHSEGRGAGEPNASLDQDGLRLESMLWHAGRPASRNAHEPRGLFPEPSPLIGRPLRLLLIWRGACTFPWAAPPPHLALTGERSSLRLLFAEDGTRGQRRV